MRYSATHVTSQDLAARFSAIPALAVGAALTISLIAFAVPAIAAEPLLRPQDRVALVGGTFVERMQECGQFEAEMQCRRPEWQLRFRNLGWSGDNVFAVARKVFDQPAQGMKRLLTDLETANPTVVLLAYGFSEAADMANPVRPSSAQAAISLAEFESGYRALLDTLREKPYRIVLMKPLAMPGYRGAEYPKSVAACREVVDRIGKEYSLATIDAEWSPDDSLLKWNRLLPSPAGYRELARHYADQLVGGEPCGVNAESGAAGDVLAEKIAAKDELFFHRHRPQNETYLFLFRKHEQGRNAAEIPQFDPLIDATDAEIWAAAGATR